MPITEPVSYPQKTANRSRSAVAQELCHYTGGEDKPSARDRAAIAWDRAVEDFNDVLWKFNRTSQDLTLSAPIAGSVGEYQLTNGFRAPIRALLVDSSNFTRREVIWVDWERWTEARPDQSTAQSVPIYYTAFNLHGLGRILIDPPPATTSLLYPTMRVFYVTWIEKVQGQDDVLNVPRDVDNAIFHRAVYHHIARNRSFDEANAAERMANRSRAAAEFMYRDWEDR